MFAFPPKVSLERKPAGMTPPDIKLIDIKEALRCGGRIDGSRRVLDGDPKADFLPSGRGNPGHLPPFLLAAFEFEAYGEHNSGHGWAFREFERLSLAARAALAVRGQHPKSKSRRDLEQSAKVIGVDLDAFPVVYAEDILQALAWVADELGPDQGSKGSAATAEQLAMRSGLQMVGCRIRSRSEELDGVRLINARLPISVGFIGCVFECPLLMAHCELVSLDLSGSALDTLDAAGLRTSGSVYLRRTVVRTPVSFAGARITGSFVASDAVFAPMVHAAARVAVDPDHGILNLSRIAVENEMRLERVRIWGGLSLRRAVIGRSLYLNQALLMSPMALMEKRLGDLLLKAGVWDRSLTIRLAWVDRQMAGFLHSRRKPVGSDEVTFPQTPAGARQQFRREQEASPLRIAALKRLEILEGETGRWRNLPSRTLHKLGLRALTSALRADGMKIDGSIFARAMVANGQIRMKYADVAGSVRLEGSLLRSAKACHDAINDTLASVRTRGRYGKLIAFEAHEALQTLVGALSPASDIWLEKVGSTPLDVATLREASEILDACAPDWRFEEAWLGLLGDKGNSSRLGSRYAYFQTRWKREDPSTVLNLRDSRLQGDLSMGLGEDHDKGRSRSCRMPRLPREASFPVEIYGVALLDGMTAGGSVLMRRLVQHAPGRQSLSSLPPVWRPRATKVLRRLRKAASSIMSFAAFPREGAVDRKWQLQRARELSAARRFRTLQMRQVTIGRDIDLTQSVGLAGIDLENGNIGGDLKFSEPFEENPRESDAQSRHIKCDRRAEQVGGVVKLRHIKVGGDAFLVFDPHRGPIIDAGMAVIEGCLDILPQVGSKSYQLIFPPKSKRTPAMQRKPTSGGFWLDSCVHHAISKPPVTGTHPGRVCRHCNLVMDDVDAVSAWTIDLRHARTTIFTHPPAAWPDPGALSLDGFAYQQSANIGPLVPRHRTANHVRHHEHRRRRFAWRAHAGERLALGACGWVLGLWLALTSIDLAWQNLNSWLTDPGVLRPLLNVVGVVASVTIMGLAVRLLRKPGPLFQARRFVWTLMAVVGLGSLGWLWRGADRILASHNTLSLALIPVLSLLTLLLALLTLGLTLSRLVLSPGWNWNPVWPFIGDRDMMPRAIEYLGRQRVTENRFKWRSAGHPVLDTYVRAARALREAGRFISANVVEEQRLRLRTEMLSWRHHGAVKLALIAVDLFSGYGFRLWRATLTLTVLVCTVAWAGHLAAVEGFLVPKQEVEFRDGRFMSVADSRDECSPEGQVGTLYQRCPDVVYAADLLLPFVDLGEADKWVTTIPAEDKTRFSNIKEPWQSLLVSTVYLWPSLVGILGLILTGIIGVAAAARIESAFARVEE